MLAQKIKSLGTFLNTALEDYRHVGSLFPSSSHAARSVAKHLEPGYRDVVEYGPGSGSITRELLARLNPQGRLTAIEINRRFLSVLGNWRDPRLSLVEGDVVGLSDRLYNLFPEGLDAVVSGIPFSLMSGEDRERVIRNTRRALRPGGKFIVYQVSGSLCPSLRRHFGPVETFLELRNFPPYVVIVGNAEQE